VRAGPPEGLAMIHRFGVPPAVSHRTPLLLAAHRQVPPIVPGAGLTVV
jgi:hypothetical protein